jgi:hypothetical protein
MRWRRASMFYARSPCVCIRFDDGRTMTLLSSFLANIDQEHFDTPL